MIQETYVTQETGIMIPEVISNYAYCKVIKKLNYNDELGSVQRLEVKNTREFGMYFEYICEAPTQSLLQKYLRDKHFIDITIMIVANSCYEANIHKDRNHQKDLTKVFYPQYEKDTYEECLEYALQQALKLIPCKTN